MATNRDEGEDYATFTAMMNAVTSLESRWRICMALTYEPKSMMSVGQIADRDPTLSKSVIVKNLKIMEDNRIVETDHKGKYRLTEVGLIIVQIVEKEIKEVVMPLRKRMKLEEAARILQSEIRTEADRSQVLELLGQIRKGNS